MKTVIGHCEGPSWWPTWLEMESTKWSVSRHTCEDFLDWSRSLQWHSPPWNMDSIPPRGSQIKALRQKLSCYLLVVPTLPPLLSSSSICCFLGCCWCYSSLTSEPIFFSLPHELKPRGSLGIFCRAFSTRLGQLSCPDWRPQLPDLGLCRVNTATTGNTVLHANLINPPLLPIDSIEYVTNTSYTLEQWLTTFLKRF